MKSWRGWAWEGKVNWASRPGKTLDAFTRFLSADSDLRECAIIVFGSSPLEMCLNLDVNSADVDMMSDQMQLVIKAALARSSEMLALDPRIQFVLPGVFMAAGSWPLRATEAQRNGVSVLLPHPLDIVFGKLHRLDEKDVVAIDLLRERFGRPTREDIDRYCQDNSDLFLKEPTSVARLCANLETLCSYYDWSPVPVHEYQSAAIASVQAAVDEGALASKVIRKLIGEGNSPLRTRQRTDPSATLRRTPPSARPYPPGPTEKP
jgi:hypothetical protein